MIFFPPRSHGNASPGQAALEPVTTPTCGCLFGPGNFPAVWENLGKGNPPTEPAGGKGNRGEKRYFFGLSIAPGPPRSPPPAGMAEPVSEGSLGFPPKYGHSGRVSCLQPWVAGDSPTAATTWSRGGGGTGGASVLLLPEGTACHELPSGAQRGRGGSDKTHRCGDSSRAG